MVEMARLVRLDCGHAVGQTRRAALLCSLTTSSTMPFAAAPIGAGRPFVMADEAFRIEALVTESRDFVKIFKVIAR